VTQRTLAALGCAQVSTSSKLTVRATIVPAYEGPYNATWGLVAGSLAVKVGALMRNRSWHRRCENELGRVISPDRRAPMPP
jgi:hypothetical protein